MGSSGTERWASTYVGRKDGTGLGPSDKKQEAAAEAYRPSETVTWRPQGHESLIGEKAYGHRLFFLFLLTFSPHSHAALDPRTTRWPFHCLPTVMP
jgi:hypothetical protein